MKKYLFYTAALLVVVLSSCSKDSNKENESPTNNIYYPLKIERTNSNGTAVIYEFEYEANNRFKSVKYYNADSVYSTITYDASGRPVKLSTAKQADAYVIAYNSMGQVASTTETLRPLTNGDKNQNVYTYEYDLTGKMIKYSTDYGKKGNFYVNEINYQGDNVLSLNQAGYNADYTYQYNDKSNVFYQLTALRGFNIRTLWESSLVIFNSKNVIVSSTHRQPNEGSKTFDYTYDSLDRPTSIVVKNKDNPTQILSTYTITWKN